MMDTNITSCYFILTENCNLRCTYCFEKDTRAVSKYMSEETAFKMIDFLVANAIASNDKKRTVNITFFGGEPMLCTDLMISMLRYGVEKEKETGVKIKFAIITNGTIYNEKVEAFLEEWYRLTGYVDIQLSIDGIPEIQNGNRPCANTCIKSSDLVEAAIPKFKEFFDKHNISHERLHVHSVISKSSLPRLYDSYLYFIRTLKVHFKFAWVIEDDWDDNDVLILDRELDKIYSDLSKITLNKNRFPFKRFDRCSGCSSGRRMVGMDTDGNIYPCHRFFFYNSERRNDVLYGNIHNENPINPEIQAIFAAIDESKMSDNPCQVCVAVNFEFGGDLYTRPNNYDEKFMTVINKHYYRFINIIERRNTSKLLESMVNKIDYLEKRCNRLEEKIEQLSKKECKCSKHE